MDRLTIAITQFMIHNASIVRASSPENNSVVINNNNNNQNGEKLKLPLKKIASNERSEEQAHVINEKKNV